MGEGGRERGARLYARRDPAATVRPFPTPHSRLPTPVLALAILRYRRPLDEVLTVVDEHRAYLRGLQAEGTLIASGPVVPRSGGMLLLRVPDDDWFAALDRVRDGDPFTRTGMAQYEILPWAPNIGVEALERL